MGKINMKNGTFKFIWDMGGLLMMALIAEEVCKGDQQEEGPTWCSGQEGRVRRVRRARDGMRQQMKEGVR